ncbi:TetR/AcrR family transcriptional regulator [Alcaligenaceae bacterium SJ-26]|nr:TetR/AcrR family transcriptional regulator [Alcaligenaceae bacterium SJ-26]
MSMAHHRKKQPGIVRRQLLDQAVRVAVEEGLSSLTLDAVARQAGVSKGGLLHHFPSKRALLEAMCDEFLVRLERKIAKAIARDPEPRGHFVRAYLEVMSNLKARDHAKRWAVLSVMLFAEPQLRERWQHWIEARLSEHTATDSALTAWIVRLAADGLWLSDLVEGKPIRSTQSTDMRAAILDELKAMTYRI